MQMCGEGVVGNVGEPPYAPLHNVGIQTGGGDVAGSGGGVAPSNSHYVPGRPGTKNAYRLWDFTNWGGTSLSADFSGGVCCTGEEYGVAIDNVYAHDNYTPSGSWVDDVSCTPCWTNSKAGQAGAAYVCCTNIPNTDFACPCDTFHPPNPTPENALLGVGGV